MRIKKWPRWIFFKKSKAAAVNETAPNSAAQKDVQPASNVPATRVQGPAAGSPISAVDRQSIFNPVLLKVGNVQTVVGNGVSIEGEMILREGGARLKCLIKGNVIQSSDGLVIVDHDAIVNGTIKARYVLVLGQVIGDINAERIVAGKTARIVGNINYLKSFGLLPGSKIRGQVNQVDEPIFAECSTVTRLPKRHVAGHAPKGLVAENAGQILFGKNHGR